MKVRDVSGKGAAEVLDLDCSRPLPAAELGALRQALCDYPILAIREQQLSAPQQAAFSRQFGALRNEANAEFAHPDDPDVLILSNEIRPDGSAVGVVDAGDFLHSDSSHQLEPIAITILHAIRNPSRGGDTEFVNLTMVYDALPAELRHEVDGRYAFHHGSKLRNKRVAVSGSRPGAAETYARIERDNADVRQPMVRTHPETGHQALYISPRFTLRVEELEEAESDALLDRLFALMRDERFTYRHRWRAGDLVLWDNRCLNHRATGGYVLPDVRRMHRTTVAGDRPFYRPDQ
jgi:taurine dioxygenase